MYEVVSSTVIRIFRKTRVGHSPASTNQSNSTPSQPTTHGKQTRFLYINPTGMRTKLSQFYAAVATCNYDVIAITETWLYKKILSSEVTPDGW